MRRLTLETVDLNLHRKNFLDAIRRSLDILASGIGGSKRGRILRIYGKPINLYAQTSLARQYFAVFSDYLNCNKGRDIITDIPDKMLELVEKDEEFRVQNGWPSVFSKNAGLTSKGSKGIRCKAVSSEFEACQLTLRNVFNYDVFSRGRKLVCDRGSLGSERIECNSSDGVWSAFAFTKNVLEENRLRYCPYCNAETVFAVNAMNGACPIRSSLDHFAPKAIFPYLALSLYNLVPVCARCNSSVKRSISPIENGRGEYVYGMTHPYRNHLHDDLRFEYENITMRLFSGVADKADLKLRTITTEDTCGKAAQRFVSSLRLCDIYNELYTVELRDFPAALVVASSQYPEMLAKILAKRNRAVQRISSERIRALLLSSSLSPDVIHSERLSKLKIDLAQQLGVCFSELSR